MFVFKFTAHKENFLYEIIVFLVGKFYKICTLIS